MEEEEEEREKPEKKGRATTRNTILVHMAGTKAYQAWKDAGNDGKHFPGFDLTEVACLAGRWQKTIRDMKPYELRDHFHRLREGRMMSHQPGKERRGWNKGDGCFSVTEKGEAFHDVLSTVMIDGIIPADYLLHKESDPYWRALVVSAMFASPVPLTDEDVAQLSSLTVASVTSGRQMAQRGFTLQKDEPREFKAVFNRFKGDGAWEYTLHSDLWVKADNGLEDVLAELEKQAGAFDVAGVAGVADVEVINVITSNPSPDPASVPVVTVPSLVEETIASVPPELFEIDTEINTSEGPLGQLVLEVPMEELVFLSKVAALGSQTVEDFMEAEVLRVARHCRSRYEALIEEREQATERLAQIDANLAALL